MKTLFHRKHYTLLSILLLFLTIATLTVLLFPYNQVSFLLLVLIVGVVGIGLFWGTISALATTLLLYFVIGSLLFWFSLLNDMMLVADMPIIVLLIWMMALLIAALLSGVTSQRVHAIFQERDQLQEQIRTLVATDPITGFDNKTRLWNELEAEFSRSKRYNHVFSFLILKLNHFDQFQNLYGEAEMTNVLHHISESIYKQTRKSDLKFRVEKDEFALLLTDTPIEHIDIVIEKLDEAIRTFRLRNNKLVTLSFEYGYSSLMETMTESTQIYEFAKEQVATNVS